MTVLGRNRPQNHRIQTHLRLISPRVVRMIQRYLHLLTVTSSPHPPRSSAALQHPAQTHRRRMHLSPAIPLIQKRRIGNVPSGATCKLLIASGVDGGSRSFMKTATPPRQQQFVQSKASCSPPLLSCLRASRCLWRGWRCWTWALRIVYCAMCSLSVAPAAPSKHRRKCLMVSANRRKHPAMSLA